MESTENTRTSIQIRREYLNLLRILAAYASKNSTKRIGSGRMAERLIQRAYDALYPKPTPDNAASKYKPEQILEPTLDEVA